MDPHVGLGLYTVGTLWVPVKVSPCIGGWGHTCRVSESYILYHQASSSLCVLTVPQALHPVKCKEPTRRGVGTGGGGQGGGHAPPPHVRGGGRQSIRVSPPPPPKKKN